MSLGGNPTWLQDYLLNAHPARSTSQGHKCHSVTCHERQQGAWTQTTSA